jgi:hypothetical protein
MNSRRSSLTGLVEQGNNIKWKLQKIRRQAYNIVILSERLLYYSPPDDAHIHIHIHIHTGASPVRVIVNNNKHIMEIHTGDIIKFGNKKYTIFLRLYQYLSHKNIDYDYERYDTMCVIIEDVESDDQIEYTAQELIDLFETEDVTFIKNLHFDWLNAEKTKKVEIINNY